jgi:hypothetical protein
MTLLLTSSFTCSNSHHYTVEYFEAHIWIVHHFPNDSSNGDSYKLLVRDGAIIWNDFIPGHFKSPLDVRAYFDRLAKMVYRNRAFW